MLYTVAGNHYPVGDGIEYVRHVAQMRHREHWIQQFPLSAMLLSTSGQYTGTEKHGHCTVRGYQVFETRVTLTGNSLDRCESLREVLLFLD